MLSCSPHGPSSVHARALGGALMLTYSGPYTWAHKREEIR